MRGSTSSLSESGEKIWEDSSNDESEENDSSEAEVTGVLCTVSFFSNFFASNI